MWPFRPFAMALSFSGEWAAAGACFDRVGDLVTEWPWEYYGRPDRVFRQFRDRTYAELGR